MKLSRVTLYFLILLLLLLSVNKQLPNELSNTCFAAIDTQEEREIFILDTLKRYSPTGYYIVNAVDNGAPPKGMTWNKYNFAFPNSSNEVEIIGDLVTVVHETNHVYSGRMAYVIKNRTLYGHWYAYYTGTETIIMQTTETFPAREIAPLIPEALRDFRYKTYVDNDSNLQSTECDGIFGLLDEFNSYYQGAQTAYDLLPWFDGITQFDWPTARIYLRMVHDDYMAHLEFKLYILNYLRYAQQKYPKLYKKFTNNKDLKRAFIATDHNWTRLIGDYFSHFDDQLGFLETKGIKSFMFNNDYMFHDPNSTYSYGVETLKQRAEYAKFQEELNRPEYQEILQELEL